MTPSSDKRTLVIGNISENPKRHYSYLKLMVDYLVNHLSAFGIVEGKVLMARDNAQMVSYLRQGKVDLVTETPFSALLFEDEAGTEVLLRERRMSASDYYTVFFVRKNSGIEKLFELKGKTIAFEDPASTAAYFVPASVLLREGLQSMQLASPREHAPSAKVGYVFSGADINTSTSYTKASSMRGL